MVTDFSPLHRAKLEASFFLISNYKSVVLVKIVWWWHKNRHIVTIQGQNTIVIIPEPRA